MKTLDIDDQTYKRLISIMDDMMHARRRNLSYDDVINELINIYQDSLTFSGENAGG
jgi:predicted CopG family antitoxin